MIAVAQITTGKNAYEDIKHPKVQMNPTEIINKLIEN